MSNDTSQHEAGMIIADDVTLNPVLDFEAYSNTIVKMITQSHPKFSIGIYGEWGTGKTTLMNMVQNKLNREIESGQKVSWNAISEDKDASPRLREYLKQAFGLYWIENQQFQKIDDVSIGIYDRTLSKSVTLTRNRENTKATVKIDEKPVYDFILDSNGEDGNLELRENSILTIWFNAWRYEREDQFAIVALLKTIGFAMGEHRIYKGLKPILLNAVKIIGKGFLSEIASRYIGQNGVEEFKTKVLPKMDFLSELDKDTIYFDGIYKIENEMRRIREENPSTRVVVFIDDLDRCSPKKALEVFESIKVFLGLEGFVYVVGLSHVTIAKLITAEYEKSEIKGEDYIKKIIQIPIILPEWNNQDVESLLKDLIDKNLIYSKYRDVVKKNAKLISQVVQNNPRDVKRFINNYIVASEIHSSNQQVDPTQLLLVQALNVQWSAFYRILVTCNQEFRDEIFRYADMNSEMRIAQLESEKREQTLTQGGNEDLILKAKRLLRDFKSEDQLWEFLKQQKNTLLKVRNWEVYRRAAESVEEIPTPLERGSFSEIITLLQELVTNSKSLEKLLANTSTLTKESQEAVSSLLAAMTFLEFEVDISKTKGKFSNRLLNDLFRTQHALDLVIPIVSDQQNAIENRAEIIRGIREFETIENRVFAALNHTF